MLSKIEEEFAKISVFPKQDVVTPEMYTRNPGFHSNRHEMTMPGDQAVAMKRRDQLFSCAKNLK